MRLVVDTNVLISAGLKASSWPGIVVDWLEKNGGLLKTAITEQEVFEVMRRPRLAGGIQNLHTVMLRRRPACRSGVSNAIGAVAMVVDNRARNQADEVFAPRPRYQQQAFAFRDACEHLARAPLPCSADAFGMAM